MRAASLLPVRRASYCSQQFQSMNFQSMKALDVLQLYVAIDNPLNVCGHCAQLARTKKTETLSRLLNLNQLTFNSTSSNYGNALGKLGTRFPTGVRRDHRDWPVRLGQILGSFIKTSALHFLVAFCCSSPVIYLE